MRRQTFRHTVVERSPLDVSRNVQNVVIVAVVLGALLVTKRVDTGSGVTLLHVARRVAHAVAGAELAAVLGRRVVALPVAFTASHQCAVQDNVTHLRALRKMIHYTCYMYIQVVYTFNKTSNYVEI